jgi:signal peptidase I
MPQKEPRSKTRTLAGLLLAFFLPIVLLGGMRLFVFDMYSIPSGSMENTLQVGDRIVVSKLNPTEVSPGDIVVFKDTKGWANEKGQFFVKRAIGLPGDTVSSDGQYVYVNGVPLDEPYVVGQTSIFAEQVVPEGHIFVLGDNREFSADSRAHISTGTQFIPLSTVQGKYLFTIF